MNIKRILIGGLAAGLALQLCTHALGNSITRSSSAVPGWLIPDHDLNGVASTITLNNTGIASITSVTLTLDLAGAPAAFNGDYYAYLMFGSSLEVLLNQVGQTADHPYGYADNGFDLTLSDGVPDIHNYGNDTPNFNPAGQLTGAWAPDGGTLAAWNGLAADGGWTLFVADTSPGGVGALVNWSLTVTGETASNVPDRGNAWALLLAACAFLLLVSVIPSRRPPRCQ